jgi:hypothetical protein
MAIVVNLDGLLYTRRMTLTGLADRVGIALTNLSIRIERQQIARLAAELPADRVSRKAKTNEAFEHPASYVGACPCRRTGFHFAGTCGRSGPSARTDVPPSSPRSIAWIASTKLPTMASRLLSRLLCCSHGRVQGAQSLSPSIGKSLGILGRPRRKVFYASGKRYRDRAHTDATVLGSVGELVQQGGLLDTA